MDSSGWLAYFLAESDDVKRIVEGGVIILTSVLSIFEIKKKLLHDNANKDKIDRVISFIKTRSLVIELSESIAEEAAVISINNSLAAIDALIYATAKMNNSILVTGDFDFHKLDGVKLLK